MFLENSKKVINLSGGPVTFEIGTEAGQPPFRITMQANDVREIPVAYASKIASTKAGAKRDSVVASLTNNKVQPVDDEHPEALARAESLAAPVEKPKK